MRLPLALVLPALAAGQFFPDGFNFNPQISIRGQNDLNHAIPRSVDTTKDAFLDSLVANMTVQELGIFKYLFKV